MILNELICHLMRKRHRKSRRISSAKVAAGYILLKLMKLMYLSARRSLADYGEPLTWGGLVSMDHGPVLSTTLNLMNGFIPGSGDWDSRISDR